VFVPAEKSPREFVTLKTIAGELAGFALFVATREHAILDLRHWFGADGANQRQCLRLSRDARGRLQVMNSEHKALPTSSTSASVATTTASAGESVIAMIDAFETEHRQASADWSWVDSIEVAVARVRAQTPTTVVLQFSSADQYDSLCSAVRDLRKLGSAQLRVVIRQRGARLRMPMALVLRLGASLIIPAGTTDTSARLHIEALRGTRFSRVCDSDIVQVSEDIRSVLNSDPQDAGQFRLSVERVLAHTESYDIEHTLVRLFAKPGQQDNALAIVEQLGRDFLVARNGVELWLFLFACTRSDVRTVLDRIFAESLNALFSDWSAVYEPQRMLAALEGIRLPSAPDSLSDRRAVMTDSLNQPGTFAAV
jgi:cellulose biosynthesis protein BcsE